MGQKTVIILSILLLSSALFAEKKTLYIKNFSVTSGFSKPEGIAIGQDIKVDMSDVINKTNRFSIVSDSEVQESLKAIEEQQQLGCDTESCMRQVMKAVQSDYLIYGTLRKRTYDGKFILSGTLMDRSKGSITIGRNKRIEFDDIRRDFRNSINQLALYLIGEKQKVTEIHTLTASERNSRGFKALRLSIFPGMGQIVYGDSFGIIEGLFFMGGTLGMGYLTFSNYQMANSSFDEYSQNGQTDAFYQDKWDKYEKYKKDSQLFMYITIGVYAINFLDAFFSGRRVERTEVSSFSLNNRFYAFANFSKEDRGINFGYMKAF